MFGGRAPPSGPMSEGWIIITLNIPTWTYPLPRRDLVPKIPTPQKGHGTRNPHPHPRHVNRQTPVKTLPSYNFIGGSNNNTGLVDLN